MARKKRTFRDWTDAQWEKSYKIYLNKYSQRYEYLFGNMEDELGLIQYKSAYSLFSQIKGSKNVLRSIVYAQDKVKASRKQVASFRTAAKNLSSELAAKVKILQEQPQTAETETLISNLQSQIQSLKNTTRYEWKSGTGGAEIFWDYLKTEKKGFIEYNPSPSS